MRAYRIAVVSRDDDVRLAAARAFDAAPATWRIELFEDVPQDGDVVVVGSDVDVRGDVRFDPERDDTLIEDVGRALSEGAAKRRVLVVGACGGAGTTTVGLHLAAATARRQTTCFVEASAACGAAPRLHLPPGHKSWKDIDGTLDSVVLAALPVAGGYRALLAPTDGQGVNDVLSAAARLWRTVIVDAGSRDDVDHDVSARAALLVVPATRVAVRRARSLLSANDAATWGIVLNHTVPGSPVSRPALERELGRRVAISLPWSRAVRAAEDEGRLVAGSWSRWARGIERLSRALV